jgi:hypothetical protein
MIAQLGCGSEKEFKAGFGSHTPMVLGQAKVVRYHPNAERYKCRFLIKHTDCPLGYLKEGFLRWKKKKKKFHHIMDVMLALQFMEL